MNDEERLFVRRQIERLSMDYRNSVDAALGDHLAEVARNRAFGGSRRWIAVAKIFDESGRAFIAELGPAIRRISNDPDAYKLMEIGVTEFLDHLTELFALKYITSRRAFARPSPGPEPIPLHWEQARYGLELDLKLQQREFVASNPAQPRSPDLGSPLERGGPNPTPRSPAEAGSPLVDEKLDHGCEPGTGDDAIQFIPTGAPGRDSGIAAVRIILKERADAGLLATGIGAEATALAEAYKNDPRFRAEAGWPPMAKGTIENNIREEYWQLRRSTK